MATGTDNSSELEQAGPTAPQAQHESELSRRVEELNDRLLRALADADNARKQAERARSEGRDAGIADVTASLVPALDSLSLAIGAVMRGEGDVQAHLAGVVAGLEATSRAFVSALGRFGIEVIEPEAGEVFDPNVHEAVATRRDETVAEGRIVETMQSGYRARSRLIRPARVVLAA